MLIICFASVLTGVAVSLAAERKSTLATATAVSLEGPALANEPGYDIRLAA